MTATIKENTLAETETVAWPRSQTLSRKRQPVPLLLSSFPTPPTHIPLSPSVIPPTPASDGPLDSFSSPLPLHTLEHQLPPPPPGPPPGPPPSGPPLSGPPCAPLPPVPGPSPISEDQTLMFMTTRRRTSRTSTPSSVYSLSNRDSSASTSTTASFSPSFATFGAHHRTSTMSTSSTATSSSMLSTPNYSAGRTSRDKSPVALSSGAISEEDEVEFPSTEDGRLSVTDLTCVNLDIGDSLSADEDGVEKVLAVPALSPDSLSPVSTFKSPPGLNESISSVNFRDLAPASSDDTDEDEPDLHMEAQALHLEMRASRSKSETHKRRLEDAAQILRSRSSSRSRSRANTPKENREDPVPPVPSRSSAETTRTFSSTIAHDHGHASTSTEPFPCSSPKRPESPDIKAILQSTPRPLRKSTGATARSRSRKRISERAPLPGSAGPLTPSRTARESGIGSRSCGRSPSPETELAYAREDPEDFGTMLGRGRGAGSASIDGLGLTDVISLDEDADEDAREGSGSETDSSLDLHTPLPKLMLRDGMLSPSSKLLPQPSASPTSPYSPDAMASRSSVVSTTSIMTKSGIFKDERDTPQRRIRHRDGKLLREGLGLTTGLGWSDSEDEDAPSAFTRRLSPFASRSSLSSARSSPNPATLSRSVSGPSAVTADVVRRTKSRGNLPSWQKETGRSVSLSTKSSLVASVPEEGALKSERPRPLQMSELMGARSARDDVVLSPSSASCSSMPVTPGADDHSTSRSTFKGKEKALPAVPRRIPSKSSMRSVSSGIRPPTSKEPFPPARFSTSSSMSTSSASSVGHGIPMPRSTVGQPGSSYLSSPPARNSLRSSSTGAVASHCPLHRPQSRIATSQSLTRKPSTSSIASLKQTRNTMDERGRFGSSPSTLPSTPRAGAVTPSRLARSTSTRSDTVAHGYGLPPSPPVSRPPPSPGAMPRTGAGMVYRSSSHANASGSRLRLPSATPPVSPSPSQVGIAL